MEKQEAIDYLNNLQPGMFCTVNLPLYGNEVIPITAMYKGQQQVVTMNQVISDLNTEFMNKITQIQKDNLYDEYDINSNRAEWKDILAIYSVKLSNGNNEADVITLNDEKVNLLKQIFWEMNEVSFTKDEETYQETTHFVSSAIG